MLNLINYGDIYGCSIPLEPVFMEGNLPPTSYSVVNEDKEYHGEITVGLTFTPEVIIFLITYQKFNAPFPPLIFGHDLSIFFSSSKLL